MNLTAPYKSGSGHGGAGRGFSVIELLVTITVTSLIVYALYSLFNQTQKALRANVTQVDVMESGRATMDLVSREIAELTSSDMLGATNLVVSVVPVEPVIQPVGESGERRTNRLQNLFFLTREGPDWQGIGYRVLKADQGVGTLYRFAVRTNRLRFDGHNLMQSFYRESLTNRVTGQLSTNLARVAEGVVHFRLTAYDPSGRRLGFDTTNVPPEYWMQRIGQGGSVQSSLSNAGAFTNVVIREDGFGGTEFNFMSNALPAYLELELGILEPRVVKQYETLQESPVGVARKFLVDQADRVHLYRQRIPIRKSTQ